MKHSLKFCNQSRNVNRMFRTLVNHNNNKYTKNTSCPKIGTATCAFERTVHKQILEGGKHGTQNYSNTSDATNAHERRSSTSVTGRRTRTGPSRTGPGGGPVQLFG